MILEAVWFKNGKEVYSVCPVMNIVCDDNMKDMSDIEIDNGDDWYSCENYNGDVDDFVIRIKKN